MYTSIPLGALNFNYNRPTFELQTATALSSDQQYSKCSLDCANLYIGQEEAVPTLSESAITAQIFASSSAAKSDWFVQQNDPPSLNVVASRLGDGNQYFVANGCGARTSSAETFAIYERKCRLSDDSKHQHQTMRIGDIHRVLQRHFVVIFQWKNGKKKQNVFVL